MWKPLSILMLLCINMTLASSYVHPLGRARNQRNDAQIASRTRSGKGLSEEPDEQLLTPRIINKERDELKPDEPSCEQLKAMWRFSKRQARAPELLNELIPYTDPFTNNKWPVYPVNYPIIATRPRWNDYGGRASLRSSAPFGKPVFRAPPNQPSRKSSFDVLYGVLSEQEYGPHRSHGDMRSAGYSRINSVPTAPQKGKFQKLKEMIQTERARELREQRENEELAAKAAALKDMANGNARNALNIATLEEEEKLLSMEYPQVEDSGMLPKNRLKPSVPGLQFSRYPNAQIPPVARRSFPHFNPQLQGYSVYPDIYEEQIY